MSPRDWAALAFISVLWGGSFFFYKVLAGQVPPLLIAASRAAVAGLVLAAFVRASGQAVLRSPAAWPPFIVMGALNNVIPFTLIAWSETQIQSGLAAILNATTPIFTVLIAWLAGAERLTPSRALGVLIGFAGVAVLIGPEATRSIDLTSIAQLAILASCVSYACAAIYWRRFGPAQQMPTAGAAGQLFGAAIIAVPLAAIGFAPLPEPLAQFSSGLHLSFVTLAALAGLAILCTALPYPMYFQILARAGPTNVLLVTLLIPISALALGGLFLGEHLTRISYAGMGIIFIALAVIDGRVFGRVRASGADAARRRTIQPRRS